VRELVGEGVGGLVDPPTGHRGDPRRGRGHQEDRGRTGDEQQRQEQQGTDVAVGAHDARDLPGDAREAERVRGARIVVVVRGRIELPTPRFSVACSTN
jgi:hypothetical protein